MKSKISFFNTSLLRKDILRFAPVWGLYTAFLVLVLGGSMVGDSQRNAAVALKEFLLSGAPLNMAYAFLCATLLFGDLFQARMAGALHALPLRRESWFLTHLAAGMAFCAVPVAVSGLLFSAVLGAYWNIALLWVAVTVLQYWVFFALAVLSAQLVGNRFAMLVVYTILNLFGGIALWLVRSLYAPLLYGMSVPTEPFLLLCPVVQMLVDSYGTGMYRLDSAMEPAGWLYLGVCAAVALGLLALALVLYRKRPLEKAGDFLVFRVTEPVFLVLYTLCAGAALHLFCSLFGYGLEYLFLIIGIVIGFFTGLMLLERRVRVFRLRRWLALGGLLAALGATLLLTWLDPLGLTSWVPEVSQVEAAGIGYWSESDCDFTDPEKLQKIIAIQEYGLDNREDARESVSHQVHIVYKLKDGRTVRRYYTVAENTAAMESLRWLQSQPEHLFHPDMPTEEAVLEKLTYVDIGSGYQVAREDYAGLVEAVFADAREGNFDMHYVSSKYAHRERSLLLGFYDGTNKYDLVTLFISPATPHCWRWFQAHVPQDPELWDQYGQWAPAQDPEAAGN